MAYLVYFWAQPGRLGQCTMLLYTRIDYPLRRARRPLLLFVVACVAAVLCRRVRLLELECHTSTRTSVMMDVPQSTPQASDDSNHFVTFSLSGVGGRVPFII